MNARLVEIKLFPSLGIAEVTKITLGKSTSEFTWILLNIERKDSASPSSKSFPTINGRSCSSILEIFGMPEIKSLPRNTCISHGDLILLSMNSNKNGKRINIAKKTVAAFFCIAALSGE